MITGHEILLILGGILVGFALGDLYHTIRPTFQKQRPPSAVTEGWDQIRHVTIVRKDGAA